MKQSTLAFSPNGLSFVVSGRQSISDVIVARISDQYPYHPNQDIYPIKSTERYPAYLLSEFYTCPVHISRDSIPSITKKVYTEWTQWIGDEGTTFPSMEHAWMSLKASNLKTFKMFTHTGRLSKFPEDTETKQWKYWIDKKCIGAVAQYAATVNGAKQFGLSLYRDKTYNNDARVELYTTLSYIRISNVPALKSLLMSTFGKYILKPTKRYSWFEGRVENNKLIGLNLAGVCLMIVRERLYRETCLSKITKGLTPKIHRWRGNGLVASYYDAIVDETISLKWYHEILDQWPVPLRKGNRRTNQTFGDKGLVYTTVFRTRDGTSRKRVSKAMPWDSISCMKDIRDRVSSVLGYPINNCMVQIYPHGQVGINPHRDVEMINTKHPHGEFIAGVSLGQARWLALAKRSQAIYMKLNAGSLYVLDSPTNRSWTHAILKDQSKGIRISLTFRYSIFN